MNVILKHLGVTLELNRKALEVLEKQQDRVLEVVVNGQKQGVN